MEIQANPSGTRHIEVTDEHLQTISRYHLFDSLADSSGIIDETVLDKLKFTVRSLLETAGNNDKALLDLCLDVLYNKNIIQIYYYVILILILKIFYDNKHIQLLFYFHFLIFYFPYLLEYK